MRDDCGTSPTICKAYKQYCYTPGRQEYLDMVTYTAHVGHNHPLIVSAGQSQLRQLLAGQGFYSQPLLDLVKTLHSILPSSLKHQYVINSGSEANDLALRLARNYTNGDDFIVFEGAYHGSLSNLLDLSTPALELLQLQKSPETHIVHPPDLYGGPFRDDDPDACNKYVAEVEAAITDIKERGGKLAAFICEPISVACGALVPPRLYFKKVFELVHQAGGVVIADETGCGMGRAGEHYWTFQHFDIVPDIVTVGKSIGNGFPLGIAITTKEVADSLGEHYSTFGGNPVASCIAKSVLEVIHGEMMLTSARSVGKFLVSELRSVQERVQSVGEVRGRGLCLGIVIVRDKETRQPHPQLARNIVARLERKGFLVSRGGLHKNVLLLTPPLCITQLDARQFTAAFEDALTEALSHPGVPGSSVSTSQGPDATPVPARTESHETEASSGNPLQMNKERKLIDEVITCPGNQVVLADDEELANKRRKTE
ncbi:5-phosphohydroxy-L-lysine phospho-lyase isoform X2 [Hyalella azteca]|nr:5-phosphohydroxy-L-lysine phospho-lyase isoform X2 [Hyalella azteca]